MKTYGSEFLEDDHFKVVSNHQGKTSTNTPVCYQNDSPTSFITGINCLLKGGLQKRECDMEKILNE